MLDFWTGFLAYWLIGWTSGYGIGLLSYFQFNYLIQII